MTRLFEDFYANELVDFVVVLARHVVVTVYVCTVDLARKVTFHPALDFSKNKLCLTFVLEKNKIKLTEMPILTD